MELKYVITDNDCFAIFSPTTSHAEVARGMCGKVVGAGHCTIQAAGTARDGETSDINVHCYGRSDSMDIKSRSQDEEIINYKINKSW